MEGGFNSTASPSKISAWDRGDGVPWTSGYLVTKQDGDNAAAEVPPSQEEVTDTAKYFTLEPGKPTDIPASTITVKAVDAPVIPPPLLVNDSDGIGIPPPMPLPTEEGEGGDRRRLARRDFPIHLPKKIRGTFQRVRRRKEQKKENP